MQKEIKLKFDAIKPFGPTIVKGKVPEFILKAVDKKADELMKDPKLAKEWDWSANLAGNVKQEVRYPPEWIDNEGKDLVFLIGEMVKQYLSIKPVSEHLSPDKIDKISSVHNYLDSLPEIGKVLSFSSIIEVATQLNNNKPLNIVNDGEQKRDFVHVDDIVQANILSIFSNINHAIFNVGTEKGYSVNEIANMFGGEKKYGETRIEPRFSISDSTLIRNKLEWTPKGNLDIFINKIK